MLIARAFVFDRAEAAADELSAFTDTGSMTEEQLQAAAALAAEGIVNGSERHHAQPVGAADPRGVCHHGDPRGRSDHRQPARGG